MKKILSALLTLILVVSLLPISVLAEGNDEEGNKAVPTVYPVWANGKQFSDDMLTIDCGSGQATYDPTEKTLILYNATITNTYKNAGKEYGIYSGSEIHIVFRDNNSINASGNYAANGIYANGNITIRCESFTGNEELTIDVGDTGIRAENGSVEISGDDGDININTANDGIIADGSLEINNDGDVNVDTGYYGLYAGSGNIKIDGNLNTVQVKSEKYGIYASEGDILLTSWGDGDVIVNAKEDGICANSGSVTLAGYGRNVEVTSGNDGISAKKAVTIGGKGKTTVNAGSYGISATNGNLTLSGSGEVDVYGNEGGVTLGNAESKVLLSGIGSPIAFKTDTGNKAVSNSATGESPVEGTNFDKYMAIGEPNRNSVVYTSTCYGVWVNGVQFTNLQLTIGCVDGTATYNPETGELTLNNATITNISEASGRQSGIFSESDITIIAKGDNKISLSGNHSANGIYAEGSITLKGNGNLDIKAGNTGIESKKDASISGSGSLAISSSHNGVIGRSSVTVSGYVNAKISSRNNGIYSNGSVKIDSKGALEIESGACGISIEGGESAEGRCLEFAGSGRVNIHGQQSAASIYTDCDVVISGSGDIEISADEKDAINVCNDGDVIISGSGNVTLTSGKFGGIYTERGDVKISGSGDLAITAYYKGIAAYNGDVDISGSGDVKIDVTKQCGIDALNVTLSGSGDVTIGTEVQDGIYSMYTAEISGEGDVTIQSRYGGIDVSNGDLILSGSGNVKINAGESGVVMIQSGDRENCSVVISGNGEIEIYGKDNAIFFYEEGQELRLDGTSSPITLRTDEDGIAVFCRSTFESPVAGESFNNYTATGAPDEASVIYTLKTPATFTVTFNMNGHGNQVAAQTIEKDDKASRPADPAASGYTFKGWYADSAFQTEFDFNTAISADTTVYAKWAENPVAPADPTVPQTGDNSRILLWALLLAASGAALAGIAIYSIKRKKNN